MMTEHFRRDQMWLTLTAEIRVSPSLPPSSYKEEVRLPQGSGKARLLLRKAD